MSADWAAASVLTRWWISGSEILASSMSMSKPSCGARRSSVRTPVEAMNVFDGTQSNEHRRAADAVGVDDGDVARRVLLRRAPPRNRPALPR